MPDQPRDRRGAHPRVARRLALALASVVLILAALEFVCRKREPATQREEISFDPNAPGNRLVRWLPGDPLAFEFVPDGDARDPQGGRAAGDAFGGFRTNQVGARGAPLLSEAERGLRILVLGDSVAFGGNVREEETFCAVLGTELERKRLPGIARAGTVEVVNLSVPGYNTLQESIAYERRADRVRPDLVLVSYVMNDHAPSLVVFREGETLHRFYAHHGAVPLLRHVPEPLLLFLADRSALFRVLADRLQVFLGSRGTWSLGLGERDRALASIAATSARVGARTVLAALPWLQEPDSEEVEIFSDLEAICARTGIRFVDLRGAFGDRPREDYRHDPFDNCHLSASGHALIGEYLSRALLSPIPNGSRR